MLAANIIGDVLGIYFLHNVYGVAFTTVIPILIGALIGYYALRKYQPFKFFDIYRLGYKETMDFIKPYLQKLMGSKA
jgi:Na+-driven multidrug efflux pump